MKMNEKIKYFKGNLTSEGATMYVDDWKAIWGESVRRSIENKKHLLVFEVPADVDWLQFGCKIDDFIHELLTEKR